MIAPHSHRGALSESPAWARYLILVVTGITQMIPILAGAYLVGTASGMVGTRPFSAERLIAGLAFLGSAAMTLHALYRGWRGGRPLGQNPALLASVALLVVGLVVLMP